MGGILSNSNLTYNFKIVAKLISWKVEKNYLVKDISGSLLQTAQTWANAGVCSASCAHAFGCLFVIACLFVLQAI